MYVEKLVTDGHMICMVHYSPHMANAWITYMYIPHMANGFTIARIWPMGLLYGLWFTIDMPGY